MSGVQSQFFTFAAAATAAAVVGYGLTTLWRSLTQTPQGLFEKNTIPSDPNNLSLDPTQQELAHMDPDTLSAPERQQLLEQFTLACEYMGSKHGKKLTLGNADKLRFYAYFKTATVGPNNTPKPSLIDFERVAMWNAWYELNGTAKIEAMICYVEQLHRLDRDWRSKVTSKALELVLGENSTLVCDDNQEESDDEDDKLFVASRNKTREERDSERHSANTVKKQQIKENKQKMLKEKFTNIATNGVMNASIDSLNAAISSAATQSGNDTMGPVFSSSTRVEEVDKLQAVTITVGDDEHINKTDDKPAEVVTVEENNDVIEVTTPIAASEDEEKKDNNNENVAKISKVQQIDRHCLTNGETILRVFMGNFYELTELDDINLFQEVIETENIAAIVSKSPSIDPNELKNDQEMLFSYKVILVDVNRVTLLHQVAEGGTAPQCGILLHTFKYPIDLPDASGNTPLMVAIGNENVEMVKYLISQGANVLAVSQDGESVEDLITLCDDRKLKKILSDAIADAKEKKAIA